VGDGTEGFANVGCVGHVAVRRQQDGAEAGRVRGVADVGFGGGGCAVRGVVNMGFG
jgi:hypothetical protein